MHDSKFSSKNNRGGVILIIYMIIQTNLSEILGKRGYSLVKTFSFNLHRLLVLTLQDLRLWRLEIIVHS